MTRVAVLLPVHNEAWLIGSVLGQVVDFARSHPEWRFVFVDDGSSDETPDLIREHLERSDAPGIELVALTPNRGKAGALRSVMLERPEPLLLFTDGDLAYSLDHLDRLVDELDRADVAIGSRALSDVTQTNITLLRRLVGTAFNLMVRTVTGLPHADTQAGLKGFRRPAARTLFEAQVVKDFAFDAELLFLARAHGLEVAEIPASVSARHSYKKSRVNMLRDPLRMFGSLIRMRLAHRGLGARIKREDRTPERREPAPLVEIEPGLEDVVESRRPRNDEMVSSK